MQKDFDLWNDLKKQINSNDTPHLFSEREVWWISIGLNIGYEQDGKNEEFHRPVLVLKKFNKEMFFGIPLTSKYREGKYYADFKFYKNGEDEATSSTALLSQTRLYSSRRLIRRVVKLNEVTFNEVKSRFTKLIDSE